MRYGLTEIAVVPLRSAPSEASEMTSQVLFGEWFEILIVRNNWTKIKLFHDAYEGWIDTKTITPISDEAYTELCASHDLYIVSDPFIQVESGKNGKFFLPAGTTLHKKNDDKFEILKDAFSIISNGIHQDALVVDNNPVEIAKQYLNSPYIWGGRTPWGIDCSGLTQTVCRILGVNIPRDASQQVNAGVTVNFLNEAKPGDLAFFDDKNGNITHVGMIAGDGKIIHASGKVRIDRIDHNGIYNVDRKIYTHSLRVIKRVFN